MKKLIFICLLLIPFIVTAKNYTVKDMTVPFNDDWTVFTRDNIENNEELTKAGLTADYMKNLFEENDIYIDAVIFNQEKATDTIEILVGIRATELERNLHKYSEKDLKDLENEMIKEYKVTDHGIYNTGKYKYVYMTYKDNGLNVYDYYTVINGYGYTIKLQKVNSFTDEDLKLLEKKIDTIYYKVVPEYEKSPSKFSISNIFIYAGIGAVLGAISAFIKKRKTN